MMWRQFWLSILQKGGQVHANKKLFSPPDMGAASGSILRAGHDIWSINLARGPRKSAKHQEAILLLKKEATFPTSQLWIPGHILEERP